MSEENIWAILTFPGFIPTIINSLLNKKRKKDTFTSPHISFPMAKHFPIYILMQLSQKKFTRPPGKNSTRWMVTAALETEFS